MISVEYVVQGRYGYYGIDEYRNGGVENIIDGITQVQANIVAQALRIAYKKGFKDGIG